MEAFKHSFLRRKSSSDIHTFRYSAKKQGKNIAKEKIKCKGQFRIYSLSIHPTTSTVTYYAQTSLILNEHKLPKQPVPDLKQTAERYLKSLEPLLSETEYENTKGIVEKFISNNGIGAVLQSKLIDRFNKTDNWMSDWWLNTAYLGYRAPVIYNSSPATVGPPITFNNSEEMYIFAARVIKAVYEYDNMLKSGKVKQEMIQSQPLDMQPYAMILGTHRRPAPKCDQLLHTDYTNHIIIIHNNNFFKLNITNNNGTLNEIGIANAIRDIITRSSSEGKPIGILTGNNRDTWAEDYRVLLSLGNNRKIITDIESSKFILCLDKEIPKEAFIGKNNASVRAVQALTGYSSKENAANRWHDKTIQFIISSDGFFGLEYEHSACEGGPVAVLLEHILNYVSARKNEKMNIGFNTTQSSLKAEWLNFEINKTVENAIKKATRVVDDLSNNIDMECFTFHEFGTNKIKKMQLSPDSFIQIAMQVAFFKLHNKPPAHYETAGLRRFLNARTECIRSTSSESVEFARSISENARKTSMQQKELMIKAISTHKRLVSEAVMAQGVDRHLYGLKMIAINESIELPELYKDVGYTKSTYFNLTSSQVAYKSECTMCFGPVVPDGYGCCYNPRQEDILFACSSFKSCKQTHSKKFAEALKQTLYKMEHLVYI